MVNYIITGDDFAITPAIREYIEKRFRKLDMFDKGAHPIDLYINALRTTAHERPDAYRVEVKCHVDARDFFVAVERGDFMRAIDEAKQELWREITHDKDKRTTLFHRGARRIKKLLKGGVGYLRRNGS